MKKLLLISIIGLNMLFALKIQAQMTAKDPVYLESIANSSKTINFIAGIYPKTYIYSEANSNSKLTLKILNKSKDEYKWKDYKVYIMLNDNTLFHNYTTKSETGDYACTYTISGDEGVHEQILCFTPKFDVNEIKYMWISFADDSFIKLLYVEGKKE